jgi:two-component system OmpR family sensor kinase
MPLAEAKHIEIEAEGVQDAQLWINELDVIAIVKNLVDNAIRYTPEGGRVDLSVYPEEGGVILKIQDTGPGIKINERERVFDPFYRTLGNDQVGSGLGLSIVRVISERIGAQVRLGFSDEVEGKGLCVCVIFPIAKT